MRGEKGDVQRVLRILIVDLNSKSWRETVHESNSLGGSSLVRELLLKYPDSFVIAPGLLTGTSAPTGGRYSVGIDGYVSSIGGFIGAYIKGYGIDAIVLEGKSEEKLVVEFGRGVDFTDASDLLGRGVLEVSEILERDGKKSAVVGKAGEMKSRLSSVIFERFRSFGGGSGAKLFEMGVKALLFSPSFPPKGSKNFIELSRKLREKLKARDEKVERVGHPCYGCPISCAAMEGRFKKGLKFLRDVEDPEEILERANDLGVDLIAVKNIADRNRRSMREILDAIEKGEDFEYSYPQKPIDEWRDFLDSVGICKDAAELLEREDIHVLVDSFLLGV